MSLIHHSANMFCKKAGKIFGNDSTILYYDIKVMFRRRWWLSSQISWKFLVVLPCWLTMFQNIWQSAAETDIRSNVVIYKSTSCADNFLGNGLIIVRYSMLQNKASARQAWNQQITYNRYHYLVLLNFRYAVYIKHTYWLILVRKDSNLKYSKNKEMISDISNLLVCFSIGQFLAIIPKWLLSFMTNWFVMISECLLTRNTSYWACLVYFRFIVTYRRVIRMLSLVKNDTSDCGYLI